MDQSTPSPRKPRIAFVRARWHADIVDQAHAGFTAELARHGTPFAIDTFDLPGAFELPLHAQQLARSGRYAGIVACALVVNGGIYRHDFVAGTVVDALMQVQLAHSVPVFSVVLTPHHFHEHAEHQQYFHRHFAHKGEEAARACMRTLDSLAALAA